MSRISLHDRITAFIDQHISTLTSQPTLEGILSTVKVKFGTHKDYKTVDQSDLRHLINILIIGAVADEFTDPITGKLSFPDVFRVLARFPDKNDAEIQDALVLLGMYDTCGTEGEEELFFEEDDGEGFMMSLGGEGEPDNMDIYPLIFQ